MPFIGNQPALSYTSFAVQHFTTSATTSYTLDHSVANENEIRLVINNVVQQPGSSYAYTASGTSLVLSSATSATDTMYAVFLGKAVQTVTPASGSVTNAMIVDGTIAESKLASGVNTITEADQFRITADTTSDGTVNTNWERVDTDGFNKIGTGLTESSGIFSFPQTGLYLISVTGLFLIASGDSTVTLSLQVTLDNSSYNTASEILIGNTGSTQCNIIGHNAHIFNVTDIINRKFQLVKGSFASGTTLRGTTAATETNVFVIRLGDSV
jgi:hypothetical protein